jgi:hypothetical protein
MKLHAIGKASSVEFVILREDGKMLKSLSWRNSGETPITRWTDTQVLACSGTKASMEGILLLLSGIRAEHDDRYPYKKGEK